MESMLVQYLEGIPGWEPSNGEVRFLEPEDVSGLEKIIDEIENRQIKNFCISSSYSLTYQKFLTRIRGAELNIVKGQVIGPITFLTSHKKGNNQLLISDDFYREIIPKILKLKALCQARDFRESNEMADRIIFFDEPILSQIGSAVLNLKKEDVRSIYQDILWDEKDYFSGIHICGNSEWDFIMSLPLDIINFDAYSYSEEFFLYSYDIKKFVENGGYIAFGIVPTDEETIKNITEKDIKEKKNFILANLKKILSIDKISERVFFTPACGMGALSTENAIKALNILKIVCSQ